MSDIKYLLNKNGQKVYRTKKDRIKDLKQDFNVILIANLILIPLTIGLIYYSEQRPDFDTHNWSFFQSLASMSFVGMGLSLIALIIFSIIFIVLNSKPDYISDEYKKLEKQNAKEETERRQREEKFRREQREKEERERRRIQEEIQREERKKNSFDNTLKMLDDF